MPQDLLGCRKRRKLKALIPCVVVFMNDPLSAKRRIDFAVFFIVLWSCGRKICLSMCHGNSENSYGCSYLLRICFIYGKWVYRGVESLCKLLTANKVPFDLPAWSQVSSPITIMYLLFSLQHYLPTYPPQLHKFSPLLPSLLIYWLPSGFATFFDTRTMYF